MNTFFKIDYPELCNSVLNIYDSIIKPITDKQVGKEIKSVNILDTDEYLEIRKIFKEYNEFLEPHFLVFNLPPMYCTEIHLDGIGNRKRSLSLNIPISGCSKNAVTEFFNIPEEFFFTDFLRNTRWLKPSYEPTEKIAEYFLEDHPIVVCPQTPHRIKNLSPDRPRISISWTLKLNWSFSDAYNYFKSKEKLYDFI